MSAPRLAFAVVATLLIAACEKPDASDVTSPSARTLLGTTTGVVAYSPGDAPPAPTPDPQGWEVRFENARFSKLENGQHSIQVVLQIESRPGPPMEFWLTSGDSTVLHWSGGSAHSYNGVVCFQLRLEEDAEALALGPGPHEMTIAFGDPGIGEPVVAKTQRVAGTVPELKGSPPGPESRIGRELLGCPRQVI